MSDAPGRKALLVQAGVERCIGRVQHGAELRIKHRPMADDEADPGVAGGNQARCGTAEAEQALEDRIVRSASGEPAARPQSGC